MWAEETKETFQLRKELTCLTNQQEIARAKEAIRKDVRHQARQEMTDKTAHLSLPELATWLDRKHGQVGFYLAQAFWAMVAQLIPDTMVSLMLHSENKYGCLLSHPSPW